jgi:hypothetical protein
MRCATHAEGCAASDGELKNLRRFGLDFFAHGRLSLLRPAAMLCTGT